MHLTSLFSLLSLTAFHGLLGEILHRFFTFLHILRAETFALSLFWTIFSRILAQHMVLEDKGSVPLQSQRQTCFLPITKKSGSLRSRYFFCADVTSPSSHCPGTLGFRKHTQENADTLAISIAVNIQLFVSDEESSCLLLASVVS